MATRLNIDSILQHELEEYCNYGTDHTSFLHASKLSIMGEMGMHNNRIEMILTPEMVSDILRYRNNEMEDDTVSMLITRGQAKIIGEFLIALSKYKHDGEEL